MSAQDQVAGVLADAFTSGGLDPGDAAALAGLLAAAASGGGALEADPGDDGAGALMRRLEGTPPAQKAALAELEALVRHVRKGRPVGTWEPRNLPFSVVAILAGDLEQGVSLEQAAGRAKAIIEGEVVKGPKWPGWAKDQQLTQIYSQKLKAAFARAAGEAAQLIRDTWAGAITPTRAVLVQMIQQLLETRLGAVLRDLWTEAWYLGERAARGVTAGVPEPDWGQWRPGDPEAATVVDTADGLRALLDAHGVSVIKAITDTRMEDLAAAISDAVRDGDTADALAARIEPLLRVQSRAQMIAQTEIARAVSAATEQTYAQQGVERVTWEIAPDERVCPVCRMNAEAGPVPRDSVFPSGAPRPPAHPWCRCALAPADVGGFDITKGWDPARHPRGGHGRFVHGAGDWSATGRTPTWTGRELREGDTVTHPELGEGHVTMVDPERQSVAVTYDNAPTPGMPGFHGMADRKYNYDPGGRQAASLGSMKAQAEALNAGKPLGDTPEARALENGIGLWVGGGTDPGWKDAPRSDAALQKALDAAPANAPKLYRGMSFWGWRQDKYETLAAAKPGFRFSTGMASWTEDPQVGWTFARGQGFPGSPEAIYLRMDAGAKALNIQQYAGDYAHQKEWISEGTFEVTASEHTPGAVILDVKQVS